MKIYGSGGSLRGLYGWGCKAARPERKNGGDARRGAGDPGGPGDHRALGLDGRVLPYLADVDLGRGAHSDYLRIGVRHAIVAKLQARLMELGFMDNDEPTDYYGEMT